MPNSPSSAGFSMPAEWSPHERTWMAFPTANATFGDAPDGHLHDSRTAWAAVANTIARYEPVTMITNPDDRPAAERYLDPAVTVTERAIDDAWLRDSGPTFLTDGNGRLATANWVFNGWGQSPVARWDHDQLIGREIAELAGATPYTSRMVNEGGGIHVDGQGTVLVTETVQLDPLRNPGWTRDEVEAELRAYLGIRKVIWLPRGLTADYTIHGTKGHVDLLAAFAAPGLVVAHTQPDPAHPDHEISAANVALLRASTDAHGRPLEVVELPAPTILEIDGKPVDYSYVNHYLANGLALLCGFDDPRDQETAAIFGRLFPERRIEIVDARGIFANGGGIHCITQQQPRSR